MAHPSTQVAIARERGNPLNAQSDFTTAPLHKNAASGVICGFLLTQEQGGLKSSM